MAVSLAYRIARREMRGGIRGFALFIACLAIGVAAIAAVGTVRASIATGLSNQGAAILGGDAELEFTYRFASDEEVDWMSRVAVRVSEITDFRSMAVVERNGEAVRALTQVKSVDSNYPLYGEVRLDDDSELSEALSVKNGLPGAVMQMALADRLDIEPGDRFRLGLQEFRFAAVLEKFPDAATSGFALGPRMIVRSSALENSGLLQPGALFSSNYRLLLAEDADLEAISTEARSLFRDSGARWRDRRNGSPGASRIVERVGAFLILIGIAGLAVGGVGVAAAVRSYLAAKTNVIAILKSLGASNSTIFLAFMLQIGAMAVLAVGIGVTLGTIAPLAFAPLIESRLPLPAKFQLYPLPLAEAVLYGMLSAAIFSLWPLARTEEIRAAELFRDSVARTRHLPRGGYLATILALVAVLVGAAAIFSGVPRLALWSAAGITGSLAVLALASFAVRALAQRLSRARALRGQTSLRLAFGSVGGPGGDTAAVVVSLGLSLTVLATVGQIASNLNNIIVDDIPDVAPSFFFVDILSDQVPEFKEMVDDFPGVSRVDTAPMLRGVITRINGAPAREVAGEHWVLRGDRGVTFSASIPENTVVTKGEWWTEDYSGQPLVSFAEEEALELGLDIGDRITVNILGREIEATITSFRIVDFSNAGIGFIMAMNPSAVEAAPHTYISTVYAEDEVESLLFKDITSSFPNITAISVKEGIELIKRVFTGLAAAIAYGSSATLLTGFVVLIGAAAAGERGRIYESAVLKTVGASRKIILASFACRSALSGASAGIVAIVAAGVAGWAIMRFVMESDYTFEPVSAALIVFGGAAISLAAGLAFALRPLAARPARILRSRE
ncbi:MAG: ABC transporter permease [Albidovulum sp.]|nr:ABC transporter permease [Albidovulum sp.]